MNRLVFPIGRATFFAVLLSAILPGCGNNTDSAVPDAAPENFIYDLVIHGGAVYDGLGGAPYSADVAVSGARIAGIGHYRDAAARLRVDAGGLAVAPGFINVLSWATESLLVDGRGMSDLKQGVTLEVFGEGYSMGPLSEAMKKEFSQYMAVQGLEVNWTTLGEYLEYVVNKGVSSNVASFIGAENPRVIVLGYEDVEPDAVQLEQMKEIVRTAMEEGAMGVSSSLIYPPSSFAGTEELVELARVAGEYGGMYISHLRSEANKFHEAVDELIHISREADVPAEIYHLKAAGQGNWHKLDEVLAKIDDVRASGTEVSANIYPYTAGSASLAASVPPWIQQAPRNEWGKQLKDPDIRARLMKEMQEDTGEWENMFLIAGPSGIRVLELHEEELKTFSGLTIAEITERWNRSPAETVLDLIAQERQWIHVIYEMMSEKNIRKKLRSDWISIGSDGFSMSVESRRLGQSIHPRSFGSFARVLGKYVREEKLITLPEAIRRMTSLPAGTMKIRDRGQLTKGYYADMVIFDPATISDKATYEDPYQYAEGVIHVFVNGKQVLKDGEHTSAFPGRVVRGPGWTGWQDAAQDKKELP